MTSHIGGKSAHQVLDFDSTLILCMVMAMAFVRRERNSIDDLNDAVLGYAVGHNHSRKAIHFDRGETKNAGNVNTDVSIAKQRRQVVVLG